MLSLKVPKYCHAQVSLPHYYQNEVYMVCHPNYIEIDLASS